MSPSVADRFRAGKRLWNPEDDELLRARFPHERTEKLARELCRTTIAVSARATILGLHKSQAYLASPAACRLRRGDNVGAPFRFKKGHAPANKGLRRPGWHRGRMKETQFKPGVPSWRTMPIGATRWVKTNGRPNAPAYLWRKVSDIQDVPWTRNWRQVHNLLWESEHGPIPAGHIVVFRNHDRADIRLENLELVSRADLMRRNSVHNLPKPLANTIQLLGQLKRKIRERTDDEKQDRRSA